ncbi:hypothetical protein [Sandaracinus amylolyticus]|uniref:hypothetical protein n=1 Tax=Sandaracinus amylolyticus TaxID=927083 RepID=UPI001F26AFC5|nr:hypothetical protein [Sandaracinus amylolyticus]UJR82177.1 Hypothetical protein I5071_42420 [Sandaracinus amylolyticus]
MTHPRPDTITVEIGPPLPAGTGAYRARARPWRTLRITRRWRDAGSWFVLFFAILWNGFLARFFTLAHFGEDWLGALCVSPFVAVGVWLAYFVPAHLVNRTTITIEGSTLSVAHAPLPWPGGRAIELDRLRRIFVREQPDAAGGSVHSLYADVDGAELRLIANIPPEQALYLAQVLSGDFDRSDERPA